MEGKIYELLQGNLSDEERDDVFEWINSSRQNKQRFAEIKNTNALSKINLKEKAANKNFYLFEKKLKNSYQQRKVRMIYRAAGYAAVLTIGFILSFIYVNERSKLQLAENSCFEMYSPPGQISEVTLADGTKVWMNSDTKISYSMDYKSGYREVYLEGEAFFDVTEDKKHPFYVKTPYLNVKVFGTSFNVEAYPESKLFGTVLVDGEVSIFSASDKKIQDIAPGEKAVYSDESKSLKLSKVDTGVYTSWKEGKISFNQERLEEIIFRLEKWYNVEFSYDDEHIKDFRFSGTVLKHKPLNQILEIIQLTSPIKFKIKINNETKNEITLSKR